MGGPDPAVSSPDSLLLSPGPARTPRATGAPSEYQYVPLPWVLVMLHPLPEQPRVGWEGGSSPPATSLVAAWALSCSGQGCWWVWDDGEFGPTESFFLLQGPSLPGPPVSGLWGCGWPRIHAGLCCEGSNLSTLKMGGLKARPLSLNESLSSLRGFQARLGFLERLEHQDPR